MVDKARLAEQIRAEQDDFADLARRADALNDLEGPGVDVLAARLPAGAYAYAYAP